MDQKELIIRVLATMRTDLAAKELELEGALVLLDMYVTLAEPQRIETNLRRAQMDLASARETLEDVIGELNSQ